MCALRNTAFVIVCCASWLYGAGSIGAISSKGAVSISGVRIDIADVPSWPVVAGDELGTFTDPAMVHFDDGSRLMIDVDSLVRLEERNRKLAAVVLSGSADFVLESKSALQVYVKDNLVTRSGVRSGTASTTGKRNSKTQASEERDKKTSNDTVRDKTKRSVSPYEPR